MSSEVAGFWIVVEKAYDFAAKQVILWDIYPSFVNENSGSDFPLVTRVFIWFIYCLQIRNIDDWGAGNPALHIDSQRVDNRGCLIP